SFGRSPRSVCWDRRHPPQRAPRRAHPFRRATPGSSQRLKVFSSFGLGLRALAFLLLIFTSHAEQELTDQIFQHNGGLCEMNLILVLEISFGATRPDADVLPTQQ